MFSRVLAPIPGAVGIALLCAPAALRAAPPFFQPVGALPGSNFGSEAIDLSEDGTTVLGNSDEGLNSIAFRWRDGVITSLGTLSQTGITLSEAGGISATGDAAAGMSFSENGTEAFRWAGGPMVGLGDLPGGAFYSHAFEISGDGSIIVGLSRTDTGDYPFRWEAGVMTNPSEDFEGELPAGVARTISNDGQVIVGVISLAQEGGHMFRWQAGTMEAIAYPPESVFASPQSVSADGGIIVGHVRFSAERTEAFRWAGGEYELLGDLQGGALSSHALDVSADGAVIVGRGSTPAGQRPFIWDDTNGMRDLDHVLRHDYALDLDGWTLYEAVGVSGDGSTIAGSAINPAGRPEAWLAHLDCSDGDLDYDGACTLADAQRFADCLVDGVGCACADLDDDGAATGRDIPAFVACLVNAGI